jgi:hypothetical protein
MFIRFIGRSVAAITTLTLVSACVSSGTSVTPEQLAQLQPGVTTETEIISKLGTPNQSSTLPDGTRIPRAGRRGCLRVAMAISMVSPAKRYSS